MHAGGGDDIVLGDNGDVTEGFDMALRHGFVRALVTSTDGADEIYGEDGDDIIAGSGAADIGSTAVLTTTSSSATERYLPTTARRSSAIRRRTPVMAT